MTYFVHDCMLQFVDAAQHMSVGDEIEIQCVYHSREGEDFSRLNLGKSDTIGLGNTGDRVPSAELILIYPKRIGKVSMLFDAESSERILGGTEQIEFSELERKYIGVGNDIVGLRASDFQSEGRFGAKLVIERI